MFSVLKVQYRHMQYDNIKHYVIEQNSVHIKMVVIILINEYLLTRWCHPSFLFLPNISGHITPMRNWAFNLQGLTWANEREMKIMKAKGLVWFGKKWSWGSDEGRLRHPEKRECTQTCPLVLHAVFPSGLDQFPVTFIHVTDS